MHAGENTSNLLQRKAGKIKGDKESDQHSAWQRLSGEAGSVSLSRWVGSGVFLKG